MQVLPVDVVYRRGKLNPPSVGRQILAQRTLGQRALETPAPEGTVEHGTERKQTSRTFVVRGHFRRMSN